MPRVRHASRTQTQQPAVKTTAPEIPAWKSVAHLRPRRRSGVPLVGIGMVIAVLVVACGQILLGWLGTSLDGLHYGYPRTYRTDAVVGQGDSAVHPSHFIALNLHAQIEVIELPARDASRAKIYLGPRLHGPDASRVQVTLHFVDRRHDQHPDMLVLFRGQQVVFHNATRARSIQDNLYWKA